MYRSRKTRLTASWGNSKRVNAGLDHACANSRAASANEIGISDFLSHFHLLFGWTIAALIILLADVAGDQDNLSALRAEGGREGARLPADAEDISVFMASSAIDCRLVACSQGDFGRGFLGSAM